MKNFLLTLAVSAAVISCRSADEKELDISNFTGTWNWVSTEGGTAKVFMTAENTGKTSTLTFSESNKFSVSENGKIIQEGTFTLLKNVTTTDHTDRVFITFSNGDSKAVRSVTATDLYLYDDVADGFIYHYKK